MAHPLASTLVSLWFAATFALCSLAIRGATIEGWVIAMRIGLALPLDAGARMMMAAGCGGIGAMAGGLVMRMIGRRGGPDGGARAGRGPIRAHAELGPQGFDHPAAEPPAIAPGDPVGCVEWASPPG